MIPDSWSGATVIIEVLCVEVGGRKHCRLWGWRDEPAVTDEGPSGSWKRQGRDSPLEPPGGTQPAHTLTLAHGDLRQASDLQNCNKFVF